MRMKLLLFVLMVVFTSTLFVRGIPGVPWHPLQYITTDDTGVTPVDNDGDFIIDNSNDLECTAGECVQALELNDTSIYSWHFGPGDIIDGTQIADNTITAADIAPGAINESKVQPGTLCLPDGTGCPDSSIAPGSLNETHFGVDICLLNGSNCPNATVISSVIPSTPVEGQIWIE